MKNVVVVIGAGSIGQAVARRVSAGRHVVLADMRDQNAEASARTLSDAGFDVSTSNVDVSSRPSVRALVDKATAIGDIVGLIHAAGVSPSQASPETILEVDLYGTALVLEEFGNVIAAPVPEWSSRPSPGTGCLHCQSSRTEPWRRPRLKSCCDCQCCSSIK